MARVAIVTGGTRGIGEAISLALKEQGRTVVANYAGNDAKAKAFADKHGISMPIAREVDSVINHGSSVEQAYRGLVAEKPGHEVHGSGF